MAEGSHTNSRRPEAEQAAKQRLRHDATGNQDKVSELIDTHLM